MAFQMTQAQAEALAASINNDAARIVHSAEAFHDTGRLGGIDRWAVRVINPRQALVVGGVRGRMTFRNAGHWAQYRAGVLRDRAYAARIAERRTVVGY